jgi:O-methyltransferase
MFETDTDIQTFLRKHRDECGQFHQAALQQCLDAVAHVISERVSGDLVEIGVYKGVMVMAMCAKLIQLGDAGRVVHLYDTFEGMTQPTADDVLIQTRTAPDLSNPNVLVRSPLHQVKRNMSLVGYPAELLRFHIGDICQVGQDVPDKVAFLRLDTDWYESTRFELEFFGPKVSPNGIITQDDYNWWSGATKAVDEYLEKQDAPRKCNHLSPHGIWWVVPATSA